MESLFNFETKLKREFLKASLSLFWNQETSFSYCEYSDGTELIKLFIRCANSESTIAFFKNNDDIRLMYFVDTPSQERIDSENDFEIKQSILEQFEKSQDDIESLVLFADAFIKQEFGNDVYNKCLTKFNEYRNYFNKNKEQRKDICFINIKSYDNENFMNVCDDVQEYVDSSLPELIKQNAGFIEKTNDWNYDLAISDKLLVRFVIDDFRDIGKIQQNEIWIIFEYEGVWIYFSLPTKEVYEQFINVLKQQNENNL